MMSHVRVKLSTDLKRMNGRNGMWVGELVRHVGECFCSERSDPAGIR
jgi:hypothetical protein